MIEANEVKKHLLSVLKGESLLLIVPPFVNTRTPIMGPHILQTIAQQQGYAVDILYVNLLLASLIGTQLVESISYGQPFRLLGERLFARSAYGLPPLGKFPELCLDAVKSVFGDKEEYPMEAFEYKYYETTDFQADTYHHLENICYDLVTEISETIAGMNYQMVGCSSNWEQNNCSIALINAIKKRRPDIITLMGGSNCEGEMAEGIASLSHSIDYIFSGESDLTFPDFLKKHKAGQLPSNRIIVGEPVTDLDNIPLPCYDSYFQQSRCFFGAQPSGENILAYETSRGCWWGQCTFCGQNGKRSRFRPKAAKKVAAELGEMNRQYPDKRILLIDKVMPISIYNELLPLLEQNGVTAPMSCEHRPDLSFQELLDLKKANVNIIKFGIETLSSGLLKLMNKGVIAAQNISLLRHAAACGVLIDWNMLWGFPNDRLEHYQEILELLPLLHHLCPPAVFRHLSLDRFSPYFEKPQKYNIRNLRPWAVNDMVYPEWADMEKLAYRFIGDYPSDSHDHPEIIGAISREVENWQASRKDAKLHLKAVGYHYILQDTRKIKAGCKPQLLDEEQARAVMTPSAYKTSSGQEWAVTEKLGVVVDGLYVPLVTASPELLLHFMEES